MKSIILCLFLVSPLFGENFVDEVQKSAGEPIKLEIRCDQDQGFLYVYRKTGSTTSAYKVATITLHSGVFKYEWPTSMPASTTKQYRYFAIPVNASGAYGPASNEVLITRK